VANPAMTATVKEIQQDALRLIELARQGEEIVITSQGQAIAKLTAIPQSHHGGDRKAWLGKLAVLRQRVATGKTGLTVEEILDEDRGA